MVPHSIGLHSWNMILEFVHFNLAGSYITLQNFKESLYHLVKSLNNRKTQDGSIPKNVQDAVAKITKILNKSRNKAPLGDKNIATMDHFMKQNVKALSLLDYDLQTHDE